MISRKCGLFNNYALRLLACGIGTAAGYVVAAVIFDQWVLPWQIGVAVFLLFAVVVTRTIAQAGWLLVPTGLWFGYMLGKAWQANGFGPEAVLCALSVMALVANVRLAYRPARRQPARAWLRFASGVEEPLTVVPYACRRCDALHVKLFGDGNRVLLSGRGDYQVVFSPPFANAVVSLHDGVDDHGLTWLLPLPADAVS